MWHMDDGWGWWMMMGWIWMVVFWGIIIWAVVTVAGRLGGDRSSDDDTAMALLERRYAAGEISKEEFEERRQTLLETRRR
jgi:putative membrane protein